MGAGTCLHHALVRGKKFFNGLLVNWQHKNDCAQHLAKIVGLIVRIFEKQWQALVILNVSSVLKLGVY